MKHVNHNENHTISGICQKASKNCPLSYSSCTQANTKVLKKGIYSQLSRVFNLWHGFGSLWFRLTNSIEVETICRTDRTALVEACRRGERSAQYELYRLYSKSMYNVCFRILNHTTEAEDVLQDAFIKFFQHIQEFRQESTVGAYLKQIVVNEALNRLRQRRVQFVDVEEGIEVAIEPAIEPDEWEVSRVRAALMKLPDGFRAVLTLHLLEEYSHDEIAKMLNITPSTSRTQFMRARNKLREMLA
ncbi:MAG: RNA polymerase sigma factor [Siphonobacter sp.]